MLEGLDAVGWGDLETANGPALDLPGRLRAVASGDPTLTAEVIPDGDLASGWGLVHQACVYSATSAVLPFLVELAGVPGVLVADQLLGAVASAAVCEGQDPSRPHGVRRVLAAQERTLIGFLDHADPRLRVSAATALGHTDPLNPAAGHLLNARRLSEADARVRAVLLVSSVACDPTNGRDWVLQGYQDSAPAVQAAAIYAGARLSLPWTEHTTSILNASLLEGDPLELSEYWFWDLRWWLPVALRGLEDYVLGQVLEELIASDTTTVKTAGVDAAEQLMQWASDIAEQLEPLLQD